MDSSNQLPFKMVCRASRSFTESSGEHPCFAGFKSMMRDTDRCQGILVKQLGLRHLFGVSPKLCEWNPCFFWRNCWFSSRINHHFLGCVFCVLSYQKTIHSCNPLAANNLAEKTLIDFRTFVTYTAVPNNQFFLGATLLQAEDGREAMSPRARNNSFTTQVPWSMLVGCFWFLMFHPFGDDCIFDIFCKWLKTSYCKTNKTIKGVSISIWYPLVGWLGLIHLSSSWVLFQSPQCGCSQEAETTKALMEPNLIKINCL